MDERAAEGVRRSDAVRHCNTCGALLDARGGQIPRAYHLVPAGQAERAAAGGHVPWSIWLCAACYAREHP